MNFSALSLLLVLTMVAVLAWRRGARAWAFGSGSAAVLPLLTFVQTTHPLALSAMAAPLAAWLWHRHARTMATVVRWGAMARRKAGVASGLDIARNAGSTAMRRRAATVRPSLRVDGWRERIAQLAFLPVVDVAVQLCRVGFVPVWSLVEDVIVVFGGPRVGKTQWLAGRVIDAPGAVLVTSTRTDLLDQVGPLRAKKGPVYVFNPVGLGLRESTITFDPLTGCADPVIAAERASDMFTAANWDQGGDRQFWDDLGKLNLAALMHAAALGDGLTMLDVQRWVADPDRHESEIVSLLHESPEPAFESAVLQFIGTNDRTRSSITSTISPTLSWLTHGPARAAARPIAQGGHLFDVATLLAEKASVFMLGGEEAQVAPLVCALTGHIAREARRLAALQPAGRLDPPLSLRLDEAALICPIPLHQWSADMGGRGVSIVACFQSRAQLVDRYGLAKAATILNNAGARILFGGTGDRDDLTYWSTLAGERDEPVTTTDMHGRVASRTTRRVPVLAPAQLANLPRGRVVVFRRDVPPIIGTAEQAWRRMDVRTVHQPEALTVRLHQVLRRGRVWLSARLTHIDGWISARLQRARVAVARWWASLWAWVVAEWADLRRRLTGITSEPTKPERPAWLTIPTVAPQPKPRPNDADAVVVLDEHRRTPRADDGVDV